MIFWVPTPFAIPAQRRSTSRMMLQRSAQAWLMMVIWAPDGGTFRSKWGFNYNPTSDKDTCSKDTNSGDPRLWQHVLFTAATDLHIVLGTIRCLKMSKIRDQDFMLITRVNKSLHWVSIDLAVDVEHNHLSEAFRGLFHRNGHIFLHVMLPEMFFKKGYIYNSTIMLYRW